MHLERVHKLADTELEAAGGAAVDWSEDEQREVDRVLGEIETGEAQEEEGSEDGEEGSEDGEGEQNSAG